MSARPTRAPKVIAPSQPVAARFSIGDTVLVVGGMSKGTRAIVAAAWADWAPGVKQWAIDMPDARRTIREDFLERIS